MLDRFGREEFLTERFRPGGHVTVIGPTGCGKTHLLWQVAQHTASTEHPTFILVKKPRDVVISRRAKELGFEVIHKWPPSKPIFRKPPRGYVVWPKTVFDPDVDHPAKRELFRRAMLDRYRQGNCVIWVDDAYGVSYSLKLSTELTELWTELRSMDGDLWVSFQKPTHVPTWAYSQAEHLFLFNDPDKRNRERFREIGGVEGRVVEDAVQRLRKHECLYIRRDGPAMCIVEKD